MKTIVLISCVSKKRHRRARARDLYTSTLFRLGLQYAEKLNPDEIFILSAKHGLLELDDEIAPYDVTLNDMSAAERRSWADGVARQLAERCDLKRDHFIFLAGDRYRRHLLARIASYEIPLQGLPIGKQLQYLKKQVRGESDL